MQWYQLANFALFLKIFTDMLEHLLASCALETTGHMYDWHWWSHKAWKCRVSVSTPISTLLREFCDSVFNCDTMFSHVEPTTTRTIRGDLLSLSF